MRRKPDSPDSAGPERLQKVLARVGLASRREIERWIADGRVTVDGAPATLGQRVTLAQDIRIDGQPLAAGARHASERRVIVYHKPEGQLCTASDPQGRPTIFENLPRLRNARWISIGRLDYNTQGLLLLTTDGELANRLMHPRFEIEREYAVRIRGELTADIAQQLMREVMLDDGPAHFDTLVDAGGEASNHWYHVTLHEGRNREVRRMFDAVNLTVSRLMRVRFGPVTLPRGLRAGRWQDVEPEVLNALLETVGLPPEKSMPAKSKPKAAPRTRRPLPGRRDATRERDDKPRRPRAGSRPRRP
jgi:23S rRNA pseudouridine2605 synthase